MSTATSLFDVAAELLAAAQAGAATTSGGMFPIGYVSLAAPAFDCCPALIVHVDRFGHEPAGGDAARLGPLHRLVQNAAVIVVDLTVTMIRCVPIVGAGAEVVLPSVPALAASAAETYQDAWAIRNHLASEHRANRLLPGLCREVEIGTATPVNPQGGCGGWLLPVRVQLDGYTP